jgi:hypothetical protein
MYDDDPADETARPTAAPHEWFGLVKRARLGTSHLGRERKRALLAFGTYADTGKENGQVPGEHVHCGVARLATDLEIGFSTAQRYLAWMRSTGLIELTAKGSYRLGLADEYRLTLPTPEQADELRILDPSAYKELVGGKVRANKSRHKPKVSDLTLTEVRTCGQAGDVGDDPGESLDLTLTEVQSAFRTSIPDGSDLSQCEAPPNLDLTDPMYLTEPEMVDLAARVTHTRARGCGRRDPDQGEVSGTAPPAAAIRPPRQGAIPEQPKPSEEREYTDDRKITNAIKAGYCPSCYLVGDFTPVANGARTCQHHAKIGAA